MRKWAVLPLFLLLFITGCDKKLDPTVISGIRLVEATSRERASFFLEFSKQYPNNELIKTHSDGLNAQADALNNFLKEIELTKGKLSPQAQSAFISMADTATARSKSFAIWIERLATPPPDFLAKHALALQKQAELMELIKAKLVTTKLEEK
jgi:hypothetical protein